MILGLNKTVLCDICFINAHDVRLVWANAQKTWNPVQKKKRKHTLSFSYCAECTFLSSLKHNEAALTMRKHAASTTALILTSRSSGKRTPKWSASVNISVSRPDHCLLILPMTEASSRDVTCQGKKGDIRVLAVRHIQTIYSEFLYMLCNV